MRAWVYKVNSKVGGWHFDRYFHYRGRFAYDMGGREWIRSPMSWQQLKRVRRGDLFVCYQADERKIYGLARAASPGYEDRRGSGMFNSVDFAPPRRGGALRLLNPVNVQHPEARELFRHIRAFSAPSRGTVHPLAQDELRALLRFLGAFNRKQREEIFRFASRRRRSS